jgi:hypothetical protein
MSVHDVGDASLTPVRLVTNGQERLRVHPLEPIMQHQGVVDESQVDTVRLGTFFRFNGGKWQYCVKFPSGTIQVLATEPD